MALPEAQVVQACDVRPAVLGSFANKYPDLALTRSYDELLDNDQIRAVVIATETSKHYEMAAAALRADKHVFVEKPMARTTARARELVELSETHDRRLMVGHLLLFHPAFRHVKGRIRRGELGDIYYLYAMRVNLGIVRENENAFESLAPHDLSVALDFLDAAPKAVSADGQSYLQEGVEDVVFSTVHFEDGRMAHLHTSWLDPHKIRKVTVVGSEKMAVIDDMESTEKVRIYDKGIDLPTETPVSYESFSEAMSVRMGDVHLPRIEMEEPLRLECQHFLECVQTGQTPRTDGVNGLMVVRLMEAAIQSLEKDGQTVRL
jgi:predicted dehydrogenase